MAVDKCFIWGTPAGVQSDLGACNGAGAYWVQSARAGGNYSCSGVRVVLIQAADERIKVKLSSWILEQNRFGVIPNITNEILESAKHWVPLTVFQRADGLLKFLQTRSDLLGTTVVFFEHHEGYQEIGDELLAWTSSRSLSEVVTLVEYCHQRHWVSYEHTETTRGTQYQVMLRPPGYERLAELDGVNSSSDQVFVAMWFNESMDLAYTEGIELAIVESGYVPMRIDKKEHIGKIDDQIIAEIRRSRFIVADFTAEPEKPRGGVYFEAGFAYGLNIPVIWTCRTDRIDEVHFDTRQFAHITWDSPDDLREKLSNRIGAVIGDGPRKRQAT